MQPFTAIIPKLLDLINSSSQKKEVQTSNNKMEKPIKNLFKQASFAVGSLSSLRGAFGQQNKGKKSDLRFSNDINSVPEERAPLLNQSWEEMPSDPNFISHIISEIKQALIKAGENPLEALPLLNYVILPDLVSDYAPQFKPGTRTTRLGDILVRLIDKISANKPLAFFLDDIQWYIVIFFNIF